MAVQTKFAFMLSLTVFALGACGDDDTATVDADMTDTNADASDASLDTSEYEPPDCREFRGSDGPPTVTLEIGDLTGGTFNAFTEDQEVGWVWGFQGGTMIQPVVRLPSSVGGGCLEIALNNDPHPDHEADYAMFADFPGMTDRVPMLPFEGAFVSGPFLNQLAWDELDGYLTVDVTARGEDFVAAGSVRIKVTNTEEGVCAELPLSGEGCVYQDVGGSVLITDIVDGVARFEDFQPTNPEAAECVTGGFTSGSQAIPETCEGLGLAVVGERFQAIRRQIVAGTCTPVEYQLDNCLRTG